MSLYFLVNNFVFAFGMVGAIVSLMAAWLSFDTHRFRPDSAVLARAIGFLFVALWQLVHAMSLSSDILSYFGFVAFIAGLLCIASSFLRKQELVVHAVIVIPAFALWDQYLYALSAVLIFGIAYLAKRQEKREQNPAWAPFWKSFLLMGIAAIVGIWAGETYHANGATFARLVIELLGSVALALWIWQFMRLRIRESLVMASVGSAFLLATVVTLAFSTILIGRVTNETAKSLVTDARVLEFTVRSLSAEALAKTELVSHDAGLALALSENDFSDVEQLSERFLEEQDLGFLIVADPSGNVITRAHAPSRRGDTLSGERAFDEALSGIPFATIEKGAVEGLSVRAASPIMSKGRTIAILVAGYPLDNVFADRMKRVTGLETFIYDETESVASSAFSSDGVTRLSGAALPEGRVRQAVFDEGIVVAEQVMLYNEPYQASYAPLVNGDGKTVGVLSAAKHEESVINIANATNRLTLVTVVLIILALLAPIYYATRRYGQGATSI